MLRAVNKGIAGFSCWIITLWEAWKFYKNALVTLSLSMGLPHFENFSVTVLCGCMSNTNFLIVNNVITASSLKSVMLLKYFGGMHVKI